MMAGISAPSSDDADGYNKTMLIRKAYRFRLKINRALKQKLFRREGIRFLILLGLIGLIYACGGGDGGNAPMVNNSPPIFEGNTPTAEAQPIWDDYLKYRGIMSQAQSIAEIQGVVSATLYNDLIASPQEQQDFFLSTSRDIENTPVYYVASYIQGNIAYLYVYYEKLIDTEEDVGVSVIYFSLEDGFWRWNSGNYGNDTVVPGLWDLAVTGAITTGARGSVTFNGIEMPIESGLGFLDRETGEITIMLYPSSLSEEDILLHRDGYLATEMFDKPTPNAGKWADWSPIALLSFYAPEGTVPTMDSMNNTCLNLNWIEERNNFQFLCTTDIQESITGYTLPNQANGSLVVSLRGSTDETLAGDRYEWDISIDMSLLTLQHIKAQTDLCSERCVTKSPGRKNDGIDK